MSELSEHLRKAFKESDELRDAGLSTPDGMERFDDILYGSDPDWQRLDVYRPKNRVGERLPVIVSVHGGGWVYGDKERYQYYCMSLAERGFAVVNFTYRLAPEFRYPAPLEDTNLVFRWVLSHGEEYGFDTGHIFAVGDSAGAHGLALYAAICTDPEYAKNYAFPVSAGFRPTAVALNCGAYRIERLHANDETMALMGDYLPEGGSERELVLIDATRYVTPDYPPVFLMTAAGDFLLPQALPMAEKLTQCGVPFVFRFYGGGEHELGHVFHLNIRTAEAARCNDDECGFFRSFL